MHARVGWKTPRGCLGQGEAYWFGAGVARDLARAIALYARACEGRCPLACEVFGMAILSGEAPHTSYRAGDLFKKACDLAPTERQFSCAEVYLRGIDVPRDLVRALSLYRTLCETKNVEMACRRVKQLESAK